MPLFSVLTTTPGGSGSRASGLAASPSSSSSSNSTSPVGSPAAATASVPSTSAVRSINHNTRTQPIEQQHADACTASRRASLTSSSGSAKKTRSRFLFTSSKKPPLLKHPSPSPTGSKSSSAETTATQSSLASSSSLGPFTPPSVDPTPNDQLQDLHHGQSPLSTSAAGRSPASASSSPPAHTTSAFIRAIKDGFRSGTFSKSNDSRERCSPPPAASPACGPVSDTSTATTATNIRARLAEEQIYHHQSSNPNFDSDSTHRNNSVSILDSHRSYTASKARQRTSDASRKHVDLNPITTTTEEMKRPQSEVEYITPDADIATLPPGLGKLCLANLGLPFLLFDSSENLVYANEAGRFTVPVLASPFASTSFNFQDEEALSHPTTQTAPASSRQRRRRNGTPSTSAHSSIHEGINAASSSTSSSSNNTRVASWDIFSHSAFDDIDFATSKFVRDGSSRRFSLVRTLDDRKSVEDSYTESINSASNFPSSHHGNSNTSHSTPQQQEQGGRQTRTTVKRTESESKWSLRSTATSVGVGGITSGPAGTSHVRPSRTRTSTDGWLKGLSTNQCQPFLRLSGNDPKTWWRSSISRIDAPMQESETRIEHYYAVLLFQPVEYEISDIVPCDDVSSIRSLANTNAAAAAVRPVLNRMPSDPPIIPPDVEGLTQKVEEAIPAIPPEFYKAAVECMPQILFTSGRDGIISYLNPQWYSYTGWDMKTPSREMWADVFHPSDVGIAVDKYSEAIRSGSDIHLQYRVKNKDGQFRWMIARGRCIRDDEAGKITGFVCTLTDGQELIDAQQKAVQTQQYISTVLQASAITLIVVDTTRKVVLFEGYTEALDKLGVTGEEAMGRLLEDAWPDLECAEQAQAMLAQQGETTIPEREFATTVGPSNLRYRITPLYESEAEDAAPIYDSAPSSRKCTGLAIVCTDISAMVRAEKALVQSKKETAELAAREEAAREASRLKTIFVTSLSHEIRTPISGMLGISELLLRDESLSPKHQALVKKQLHAGEVLLQLVSMVLDLGKMEANKLDLENEPFLLSDLMKDLDIFASLADAKDIYFERILDVRQDCLLQGDRLRLAQVLSNFISNAVKFTSHGGITLRVEQEERDKDYMMVFQLEDTGTGIDKDTLPHLFKPFHQGNVTIARRFGGSGLGLSIAKTLTELMGGTVTLDSALGVGTTVRLQIPFQKPATSVRQSVNRKLTDPSMLAPVNEDGRPQQELLANRREDVSILIAEDNPLLQEIYSSLVKKMRFGTVRVVEDGILALEAIEEALPHVVLMDIEMPRMNGPDAVRVIRSHANPAVREIKIVALTANAVSGDKERFLAMGMDMYLSKPVRATKLEEAILECLQGL